MSRRGVAIAWSASIALLFLSFWLWWGGSGRPLTVEEGEGLLARVAAVRSGTEAEAAHPEFRANMTRAIARDDGREFYMVNLERVRAGQEAQRADAAYARIVIPEMLKRGSMPVYIGVSRGPTLGDGRGIDRVAIVRYRSLRDFLDMNAAPGMRRGRGEKFASLIGTDVLMTRPLFSAVQMRLLVGAVLAAVWLGGLALFRPRTVSNAQEPAGPEAGAPQ